MLDTDENITQIDDVRGPKEFRGITFSGFKKTDVKKELLKHLHASKIEPACYWCAEFVCAGHYYDLWDIIIEFYFKHIHVGNPKMPVYLETRWNNFIDLVNHGFVNYEIGLRNVKKTRTLFSEIICVLCESKRHHAYAETKIKDIEFDLTQLGEKLKAPNSSFAEDFFLEDDPRELYIATNELAYNLSETSSNCVACCYWVEWIIAANIKCKRTGKKLTCERRDFANVANKFQMDIVWLIWSAFLNEADKRTELSQIIVYKTLNLFCLNYTAGCINKRKLMMYFVIAILTEPIATNEQLVEDKNKTFFIVNNIDKIYKQINKNRHSSNTDYMFDNLDKDANLNQTIKQLDALNKFNDAFIPRSDGPG